MADNDPKQFRPAGETPDNRNFNADEDPLVELARIVSEDGGFYSKTERTPPVQPASPEARDAFSADLEAELMQELEYSLRARQESAPPQAAAPFERRSPDSVSAPAPVAPPAAEDEPAGADVSFDEATAADPYQDDPAELLRALQEQLGGFGHRVVAPAPAEEAEPAPAAYEPEPPAESRWADEAPLQEAEPAGYAAADAYRTSYDEPALTEDPFATADADSLGENPFLTPEPEAAPDYGATAGAGDWDRSWAAADDRDAPATAETFEAEEVDYGEPDAVADPVKPAPAWASASAAAVASAPRWLDRQSSRPVAANDDPLAGADQAGQAGRAGRVTPASEPACTAAASATETPDWLTSGHDVRRDLRPTMADFDTSRDRAAPAYAGGVAADTEAAPAVYAEDQPAETWSDQGFESGIDDLAPREDATIAPVSAAAARGRSAAYSADAARRSRRNGLLMAGIVGAVVIGGAVAAYVQSTGDDADAPPPVIRAEQGDVKVEARNEPADSEADAGNVVYNPPASDAAAPNEQLVDSAEEPREVARVVLPPPQAPAEEPLARPLEGVNAPAEPPAGETVPAQNGAVSPIGPRKVRTVVVRPDGTIVASSEAAPGVAEEAAPPPEIEASAQPSADSGGDPLRANPVRTTTITSPIDGDTADPGALVAEEPGSATAEAAGAAEEPIPDTAAETDIGIAPDIGTAPDSVTEATNLPRPRPQVSPEAETQVALRETQAPEAASLPAQPQPDSAGTPIDLLAGSPGQAVQPQAEPAVQTAARSAPEPVADGFFVQLSSQRTESAARASAASLKRQFASVLGPFEPSIQQADLGVRGTFYRARIGPMATRAEAVRVCESLQAAGGSCFVGR